MTLLNAPGHNKINLRATNYATTTPVLVKMPMHQMIQAVVGLHCQKWNSDTMYRTEWTNLGCATEIS